MQGKSQFTYAATEALQISLFKVLLSAFDVQTKADDIMNLLKSNSDKLFNEKMQICKDMFGRLMKDPQCENSKNMAADIEQINAILVKKPEYKKFQESQQNNPSQDFWRNSVRAKEGAISRL